MLKTAGIVTCKAGYLAISLDEEQPGYWLLESDKALTQTLSKYDRVFVNIPVGLEEDQQTRACDELLREKLGADYSDSVVDPPIRAAVEAPTYGEASMISYEKIGTRVSMQSWGLSPQIRTIRRYIQACNGEDHAIYESHPELLYQILNGDNSILQKKITKKGLRYRLHLIDKQSKYADDFFRDIKEDFRRNQVGETNIIDALALALFAQRSSSRPMKTIPDQPSNDSLELPKAIHYV